VVLLIVPLLKGPLVGTDVFLFSRLAENPSSYDSLSFGGRFAAYQWGTPLILSLIPNILIEILPFMLGILSFFLFRKILKQFIFEENIINLTSLLLILSPCFIYLFSFTNGQFIAVFLSLAGFYFFINKELKWWSLPIFAILPMFNITIAICLAFLLLFYVFSLKKERKKFLLLAILIAIITTGLYYGYILLQTGIPSGFSIGSSEKFFIFKEIFYDLGSPYGIGIFLAVAAIIGIVSNWERKYLNLFLFFSIIVLGIISLFRQEALIFLNLFMVIFATRGLVYLIEYKWTDKNYKKWIILIILSGLVFSGISQMNQIVDSMPNQGIIDGLEFLSTKYHGTVLSDYSRGVWINYAGHKNVIDENYLFESDAEERWKDVQNMFYSRDFENTKELFKKYNINYVWIDEEMKERLWSYDSEGLLFILQYTKDFNKVYDKNGVEIWEIQQ
jgi:hypothetical protein